MGIAYICVDVSLLDDDGSVIITIFFIIDLRRKQLVAISGTRSSLESKPIEAEVDGSTSTLYQGQTEGGITAALATEIEVFASHEFAHSSMWWNITVHFPGRGMYDAQAFLLHTTHDNVPYPRVD